MGNQVKKTIIIICGSIISAYGITLAMFAGFGSATLAVLWQGVSNTFGITIGQASFAIALVMIAFGFVYDKHQLGVGTILYQIVYSYFVDVFAVMHRYPDNMFLCFIIMCLGIVLFGIGTGMYCAMDWGRGSYDLVTFAIAEKNNFQTRYVRMTVDAAVVILGALLGGKFGICTIVTILFSGNVIQLTTKSVQKLVKFE